MECERRKVYVEVNVTHRPDGTARPNSIKFENDEIYEVDRVMQKCRAAATKVLLQSRIDEGRRHRTSLHGIDMRHRNFPF